MDFLSVFKHPDPIDVPEIGTLKYDHKNWLVDVALPFGEIELMLDGDKKGPDAFARNYWLENRSRMPQFWKSAIAFSIHKLEEWGWGCNYPPEQFELWSISVHKEGGFDGGHLAFWFNISSDAVGAYYVSFRDEEPHYFHRDGGPPEPPRT
ncbi:MAG: hypothetical protein QNJ00_13815 [Woeseiaceae bacterium]|nr:hypothetical protein [Woeseiaceae bacterium]